MKVMVRRPAMKVSDFTQLCDRHWCGSPRGDVIELALTLESACELADDAAEKPSPWVTAMSKDDPFGSGLPDIELMNPITRSAVHVIGGAVSDTAIVSYGSGRVKQVRA
jgi:hypothetical protein